MGGKPAGGGGGDISTQIDSFNTNAGLINGAVSFSLVQIVAALGDKEQIATVKTQADNLGKATDAKEKGAAQGSIIKTTAGVAAELLNSKDAKAKMEKLSPEMQQKVAKSLFAVGVAALQLPGAIDQGKKIMQEAGSNPMNITKVMPVKDGLSMFADALPKLPSLVSTGFKLMRDVKVEPGNPSVDAKLKAVNSDDFNGMFPNS